MRKIHSLVVLLILALAACAETPEPTAPAVATPAASPSSFIPSPSSLPPTASPSSSIPPTSSLPPAATPSSFIPPPSSLPPVAESPWPRFLRELNFGIPAGNSDGPRALAIHPGLGRLYVRTYGQGSDAPGRVVVMDLANGQVLAIVETGPDSFGEGALIVDTSRDRVYALNPGDVTCSVLDAETLEPVMTLADVNHLALDVEAGRLYVTGPADLRVLDAVEYTPLGELSLPLDQEFLTLGLDPAAGRVYLAVRDASGYSLGSYDAATLQMRTTIALPGRPDDFLPDPARDRLYVTLNDGEQGLFWSLDGNGRLVQERQLGERTQKTHLALDPEGNRLFLGRETYGDYGITLLDLQTGQELGDIPLKNAPTALAWDKSGRLLVSHTYADQIGVVNVKARQVSDLFPTAIQLLDLAADPDRGHLYVTDTVGRLHILDSETDEELAVLPGEGRLSLDIPHGRLYTGGEGADRVRIFDTNRLQQTAEIHSNARPVADAYDGGLYLVRSGVYLASLETMTITAAISDTLPQNPGFSPNPAATDAMVDPGSGRLFAIINNGVPGSNSGTYLYVYEPQTYQKVLTDTERSPIYLDIDPNTGRAYVSRIHMTFRSTSLLAGGHEYTARLEGVFGALRIDPALGRVYLTIYDDLQGQMLILDAADLDVLGSVPIPGGFTLRALDPRRHLLYLASEDGRVQIWSATRGDLPPAADPAPADLAAAGVYRLCLPPGDVPLFALDKNYFLHRSDDGGNSWERLQGRLPAEWVLDVAFSPDFAQDQTLFAGLATADQGFGVWKSTDGGKSWLMASVGLSDLAVTNLEISPDFAVDQTLFAAARRGGLFRSTDGGQTWVSLTERYYPQDTYPQQPGVLALSPTYGQDHTLFVHHDGLYRSTDGGDTWAGVFPGVSSLAFSPDFASDQTVYGWTGGGGLLRSTDGGETWAAANVGMILSGHGSGRVVVPPDYPASQILYCIWNPSPSDAQIQLFRSTDSATTWERLVGEPPQAATPIELTTDGTAFVALDNAGRPVRWPVAALEWQAATPSSLDEILINRLILSPSFAREPTLLALSEGAGVLRSDNGGLTWADTSFPIRDSFGLLDLVLVPPDTLYAGTALGLYRSTGNGPWSLVDGGLPQGVATTSPVVGADGSLRVLASSGSQGSPQAFLSLDNGESWTQPLPDLPTFVDKEHLLFSPAFATDHTAFAIVLAGKPYRSLGGSDWLEFGPSGIWSLWTLQLSPVFDRDGLLFLSSDDYRLWRSIDQGDTWTVVSGPWGGEMPREVTLPSGYTLKAVTFSAAFEQDGVLLTQAGNSLYHSADRGETWTRVLDLGPFSAQAVFTPDYARDGRIYLLLGRVLYLSTNRGQAWQALPPAPWGEYDEVKLLLSPTFSEDNTMLGWMPSGRVYQSSDGGQSWQDISGGLPARAIRQVLFSPNYAADGLIYLAAHDRGLYKRRGDSPWLSVTEKEPAL